MTGADQKRRLVFQPVEQIAGFVLSMAIWDLHLGCRVEPDLFSATSGGLPRVMQSNADDYTDAIQTSLSRVEDELSSGAVICAFAYQGSVTRETDRQRCILVRCFWHSGAQVLLSLPFATVADQLSSLGSVQIDVVPHSDGEPPRVGMEAVLSGINLFSKGAAVWKDFHASS